jgi:hypothetical protein
VGNTEEVLVIERDEDENANVRAGAEAGVGGDAGIGVGNGVDGTADARAGGDVDGTADARSYPLLGRTKRQAPEVDGMVHLDRGTIGELLSVRMVEAYCYELDGRATGTQDA